MYEKNFHLETLFENSVIKKKICNLLHIHIFNYKSQENIKNSINTPSFDRRIQIRIVKMTQTAQAKQLVLTSSVSIRVPFVMLAVKMHYALLCFIEHDVVVLDAMLDDQINIASQILIVMKIHRSVPEYLMICHAKPIPNALVHSHALQEKHALIHVLERTVMTLKSV